MTTTPSDPIAELVADRERARAAKDPFTDLCVLATHDAGDGAGAPGVRTLVLRDTGPQGIGLLISGKSPKWAPLEAERFECLLPWLSIRRQYRVRGRLAPMPGARIEQYWEQKVHTSRLLDVYYDRFQPQSSAVASRAAFLDDIESLRRAHPTPDAVPRPDLLRGVYLVPLRIEIWRGSPDRLHDRRRFSRDGDGWREEVLVP
jgi:pyridoxamine 5'-phosphate oxidase